MSLQHDFLLCIDSTIQLLELYYAESKLCSFSIRHAFDLILAQSKSGSWLHIITSKIPSLSKCSLVQLGASFNWYTPTVKFLISFSLYLGNSRTEETLNFSHLQDRFSRPADFILSWMTFCCFDRSNILQTNSSSFSTYLVCFWPILVHEGAHNFYVIGNVRYLTVGGNSVKIFPLLYTAVYRFYNPTYFRTCNELSGLLSSNGSWDSPFFYKGRHFSSQANFVQQFD